MRFWIHAIAFPICLSLNSAWAANELCAARADARPDGTLTCRLVLDGEVSQFEGFTRQFCEDYCKDACNALGFSARRHPTLISYFVAKRIPAAIAYNGLCPGARARAESYARGSRSSDWELIDTSRDQSTRGLGQCSRLPNNRRLIFIDACPQTGPSGPLPSAPAQPSSPGGAMS